MKPATRILATAPLLALAAGLLTASCGGAPQSTPPGPSAACRTATAAQDAYVRWVTDYTSFPDDSASEGMAIQQHDLALLTAMTQAGCPDNTPIQILPGS